jgi:hypothetical protein
MARSGGTAADPSGPGRSGARFAPHRPHLGTVRKVEIVVPEGVGRARPSVDKLGAVGEPESLTWLRATTEAMLPRIDLPDLLFKVHSWTGFLDAFGHVAERRTRMEGLLVSLVALLVSQSCNIGLSPVIDSGNKALTRSRLSHVDQNYVRAETLAAANAALITEQLPGGSHLCVRARTGWERPRPAEPGHRGSPCAGKRPARGQGRQRSDRASTGEGGPCGSGGRHACLKVSPGTLYNHIPDLRELRSGAVPRQLEALGK